MLLTLLSSSYVILSKQTLIHKLLLMLLTEPKKNPLEDKLQTSHLLPIQTRLLVMKPQLIENTLKTKSLLLTKISFGLTIEDKIFTDRKNLTENKDVFQI